MNCCICGPVKNCEKYLYKVLKNVEKIGQVFNDYRIIIFYDHSYDNTLNILKKYSKENEKFSFYVNNRKLYKFRTHNLAYARNFCLSYVYKNKKQFPYFIMMDFDDVNCKTCYPEILTKYLSRTDWDALSFNTDPSYYDIWALSIYPYCFSYNHFDHNVRQYNVIQKYVQKLLDDYCQDGQLLPCMSAFNGFSIYRTSHFKNCFYDGSIRLDLVSKNNLLAHKKAAGSNLLFKKYVTVNGKYEDCEHRAFHLMASANNKAIIRISPEIIFK